MACYMSWCLLSSNKLCLDRLLDNIEKSSFTFPTHFKEQNQSKGKGIEDSRKI